MICQKIGKRRRVLSLTGDLVMILFMIPLLFSCNDGGDTTTGTAAAAAGKDTMSCMKVPSRFGAAVQNDSLSPVSKSSSKAQRKGMVLIPGGEFDMGADNDQASRDEYPKHRVRVDSFWMDTKEVTNAEFREFVKATGYITIAERKPDWEEMKRSLPPGTPKPADEQMQPASLVFHQTSGPVDLRDYSQWWKWVIGASWKHPEGPGSSIEGKDDYPVVQVCWYDAEAYCRWAGKRLPTEAEWEFAARGSLTNNIYPWGNQPLDQGAEKANTWEGKFPYTNEGKDGYKGIAPTGSFKPNGYGLYDMAGNVWEWCSDWYDANYYTTLQSGITDNPKGPSKSFDPEEQWAQKKSLRGGSFLCNESYCTGYRNARRMKSTPETGLQHAGFRCVANVSN